MFIFLKSQYTRGKERRSKALFFIFEILNAGYNCTIFCSSCSKFVIYNFRQKSFPHNNQWTFEAIICMTFTTQRFRPIFMLYLVIPFVYEVCFLTFITEQDGKGNLLTQSIEENLWKLNNYLLYSSSFTHLVWSTHFRVP